MFELLGLAIVGVFVAAVIGAALKFACFLGGLLLLPLKLLFTLGGLLLGGAVVLFLLPLTLLAFVVLFGGLLFVGLGLLGWMI